ncbi:tetratricopeptide repeat protein, partial [Micromonospora zamorensis]|uniref:tetratricopeptide repeat protein n=1 Tax=Micromonospora zamorensis TaxID=709883 RepID=UPI003CF02D85
LDYRAVLAAETRLLGENHPSTLTTRYALAGMLRERGELDQAELDYRTVLAAETRLLGENHPSTLTTRQALAN